MKKPPTSSSSNVVCRRLGVALACWLTLGLPAWADPDVLVHGGAQRPGTGNELGIWANSPQTAVSIHNPTGGFLRTNLHWYNVPAGSYLATPQGVADAATHTGGGLVVRSLLAGNGSSNWQLEPNIKGDYGFAVTGGDVKGLNLAKKAGAFNFAMHLGNSGLKMPELLESLESLPFPTYVLPGNRDSHAEFISRTGEISRDFAIERDRFLLIDNANARLSKAQRAWIASRLQRYRREGARRIFAFLHRPLVDPRRGKNSAMHNRYEVRALQKLFQEGKVTAVFASHLPIANQSMRHGVNYYIVGSGHALLVQAKGEGLSLRMLP